ncbi:type III polyketide synthase [Acidipila sp. EB88]|uniref:type III polyketide synthase n=1 Tax=Acidipila sp. EB88 TaxID=2305226 RepID=UPI000F5D6BB1|nr:3-oxoacyl-[acyl-carrier-protein] synthase III C-terminal domain-containing protein [Acidipila sp. EB88]RRA48725.1 type III polyketide synthase [Acidipila sp. EB88]
MSRIAAVASALPPRYHTQQEVFEELSRHWSAELENPALLQRFHQRVGVDGRYFALPLHEYAEMTRFGQFNAAWLRVAEELGEQAINTALERAGLQKEQIGALLTVTVTGVVSPSLDAHLCNRMGLPGDVRRTPIFGLGCVAGAAGIAQADDYVKAYPDRVAVLLSVELCSLTWQRHDLSVANLIASGLFGDGAAAVIVAGDEVVLNKPAGPAVLATASSFYPDTEEAMGWDIGEEGFRIVLSPEVPAIVRKHLPQDLERFLAANGLERGQITSWVLHTGGPKVLEAMAEAAGVTREECHLSWESLRKVGNLSSASVLFVLEDTLRERRPPAGSYGILAAMGPGFCSQLVLLGW